MDPPAIHVCVPAYGCRLCIDMVACLLRLRYEGMRRGIPVTVRMVGNESLIPRARSMMAGDFLHNTKATHMLFIDADIVFNPEDVFEMLLADKDVVCGIYAKKAVDWERIHAPQYASEPVCQRGIDFNINFDSNDLRFEGKFCRVLDAATGFMLIKRGTIATLADRFAFLTCVNDMPAGGMVDTLPRYVAIFDCMIDPESRRYLSEDYAFSRRVQWCGLEVWCMMTAATGHIGSMHVDSGNPRVIEPLAGRFAGYAGADGVKVFTVEDLRRTFAAAAVAQKEGRGTL